MARSVWAVMPIAVLLLWACGWGAAPGTGPTVIPTATQPPTASPSPISTLREASPSPSGPALAIINGTLIDGTGTDPVEDAYVLIRDGRIEAAGCCASRIRIPSDYEIVDAGGGTIMPGLIDGHVHVTRTLIRLDPVTGASQPDDEALVPFLHDGFTTLRDVGTATVLLSAIKFRTDGLTERGSAPRVVWAGPLVTAPGGYPFSVPAYAAGGEAVASPEDGAALVDRLDRDGATLVKLGLDQGYYEDLGWPLLDLETIQAITGRAHELGMLVTAHVTSIDEVRLALDGGVDNLAHSPLEPIPEDVMREMLDRGMGLVTTATVWGFRQEVAARNAARYANAGGIVSIGTDYGCCGQAPGIDPYLHEMRFLAAAGMTPMQLLLAATRNGALVSNLDDVGTIEPGKRADVIVVSGDPLQDLDALANVQTVILGGRVVYERG
jgi:imidazolonepropionase-like amidohydrolase